MCGDIAVLGSGGNSESGSEGSRCCFFNNNQNSNHPCTKKTVRKQ